MCKGPEVERIWCILETIRKLECDGWEVGPEGDRTSPCSSFSVSLLRQKNVPLIKRLLAPA